MNVNIERALESQNEEKLEQLEEQNKEQLEQLLNMLGMFGGFDPETFEEEKKEILESGVTYEDFAKILGENLSEKTGTREQVKVYIQRLTDTARTPVYAHDTDACADIYADENIILQAGQTALISTGIALAIPEGYVIHIYPRSSIGAKTPLRLGNSVGVIDCGYRDEIKVIYTNTGTEPYEIKQGDRIAQMCIDYSPMIKFAAVDNVKSIGEDREGGIGSTGTN